MEVGGKLHSPAFLLLRKQDMPIVECKAGQNTKLHCLEAMVNEKYIRTAIAKRTAILLPSSGYICQFKQDQTSKKVA
jgi:hypothetical protein